MSPPDDAPAGVLSAAESFVRPQAGSGDPLWYKDALIYQLHVKAFFDAVIVGIEKRLDVQLINQRVLVPQRIAAAGLRTHKAFGGRQHAGRGVVRRTHDRSTDDDFGKKPNQY